MFRVFYFRGLSKYFYNENFQIYGTQSINVHTVLFYNCMTILTMLIVYLV